MWGYATIGDGPRNPLRIVAQHLPDAAVGLNISALEGIPLRPVSKQIVEDIGDPDWKDALRFTLFHSQLTGREACVPAKASSYAQVCEVIDDFISGVDGVMIWGNARWFPRLVGRRAMNAGKAILYVEQGWFRDAEAKPTYIVDPVGIYTQGTCLIDLEWSEHDYNQDRAEYFIQRYKRSRQTKHRISRMAHFWSVIKRFVQGSHQPSSSISQIRKKLDERKAKCLFVAGQMAEDSAQFWGCHLCSNVEDLCEYALAHVPDTWMVVCKPHPFDRLFAGSAARRFAGLDNCVWAPYADIHELIQLANAVLTINSNVGLEASLYRKPVLLAGEAVYGRRGFTRQLDHFDELPMMLGQENAANDEALLRFIDYVVEVYLIETAASSADEMRRRMDIAHRIAER